MAKQEQPQKQFDCKTCTEKTNFLGTDLCNLRIKSIDELQTPNESSMCENIKSCEYYRKNK